MAQHKIAILLHDEFEMWRPPPWFVDRLRTEFSQVEVCNSAKKRDDEQALSGADVMIGWSLSPEQFRAAQDLRWIDLNLRHAFSENSMEMRWRVFVEIELDFHAIDNCECRHRENFPCVLSDLAP